MSSDKRNWHEILVRAARYGLAAVFLTSALAKLLSPSNFHVFVSSIGVFSSVDSSVVLYTVLLMEFVLAVLILYPVTTKVAATLSFAVLVLFSFLLLFGFAGDTDVGCGCFGEIIPDSTTEVAILRNVLLLFLCAFVAKSVRPQMRPGPFLGGTIGSSRSEFVERFWISQHVPKP
jgi:uncharacterized membrane protein YphA (DoxX/SURF4 family)